MSPPIAMARYDRAWPLAGAMAAGLTLLALGLLSWLQGTAFWAPVNASTQIIHGPDAARFDGVDWAHTGLGVIINVAACFFWAAVAVFMMRSARKGRIAIAWITGLGTAAAAGAVDYALLPRMLRPGWELVLSPLAVIAALAVLGVGLSLGLIAAHSIDADRRVAPRTIPAVAGASDTAPEQAPPRSVPATGTFAAVSDQPPLSEVERLRHPAPHVIDQRQQRIDPAGKVTGGAAPPDETTAISELERHGR